MIERWKKFIITNTGQYLVLEHKRYQKSFTRSEPVLSISVEATKCELKRRLASSHHNNYLRQQLKQASLLINGTKMQILPKG